MFNIKITCDSTCDLSPELYAKHDIAVFPLYVILGDGSFRDGVDVDPEKIYAYVDKNGVLPKTSAGSFDDYCGMFKPFVEAGDEVVHFNISGHFSSTYQNAVLAAKELGHVRVIDTQNLSTGSGHLVMDAVDMRAAGASADEIAEAVAARAPFVRASFVLDRLDYMRMGGRCTSVQMLGANLLKIKPRIEVRDGKMGMYGKYRGAYEKILMQYVDDMLSLPDIDPHRVFITHTYCEQELVDAVVERVKAAIPFEEVYDTVAGCVVTSHCGPHTLGVLFEVKK